MKEARDAYVTRLNGIYSNNLKNSEVEYITGTASFESANSVVVDGKDTYTADNILIAVGGRPWMPNIPGVEHCISSDGFFELEKQPEKVAVIGGGYIGVELAGVFHALGTETHIFTRAPKVLKEFDSYIIEALMLEMKKSGLEHHPGMQPVEFVKGGDGKITIKMENGESHGPFDSVVMAVGRKPLVEPLALDKAGVSLDKKGFIAVNEIQETSAQGVYALGDVCDLPQLTPTAIAGGRRLADRLFTTSDKSKADYDDVPTVVFSHPTIGTVGLTEEQATAKHGADKIKTYTSTFVNLWYGPWRSMEPKDKPKTAMKLVCLLPEEKVIGIHLCGMSADEILQGFAVALKMGATKADLDSCVALHPTAAEELVTMAPWGLAPPNPVTTPTKKK